MDNLDSDPGALIAQLILVALLTAINGFFASAEIAIISVNKSKIRQLSEGGNDKAKLLELLIQNPSNFLSTIQIGITLAGFFSSASAATGISNHISGLLAPLNIIYYKNISIVLVTLILSYLTLVFGELVPKRIALKKVEKISLFVARPIYIISKIAKPFINFLSISTTLVLKLIGHDTVDIEEKISEEEIRSLVSKSQRDGCIGNDEKQMIYGVFEFNGKTAREIMTSRNDMFSININDNINDILNGVLNSSYSRVPVYESSIDNIVGILYVKDLLMEARKVGFENINLKTILHKPYFVPETQRTNELFKILKAEKVHLALLFDEYGGIVGIVTLEDLIEEVMGDIEDEYDKEESIIVKIDDNNFMVKGYLTVSEFNNKFNIDIKQGQYDTLNGYLLTLLGKIPEENKVIQMDNVKFTIKKVDNRRIEDIEINIQSNYARSS